jgi:hypothetical protein
MNHISVHPGRILIRSFAIMLLGPEGFQGGRGAKLPFPLEIP